MGKLKKTAIAIGAVLGSYLLHFPARLLEDWVMGEIEGEIIENWQLYLGFFLSWILPFIVVFGAIWLGYWAARRPKHISKGKIPSIKQIPPNRGTLEEAKVSPLIRGLHERMAELKDEAVNRKITLEEIEKANLCAADALDIITKNGIEDIIKKLRRRLSKSKRKSKGEIIELAKSELSSRLEEAQKREYNIEDIVKIGRILDGKKIGLARLRDRDKDWQKFYDELRFIKYQFADSELDLLIKEALDMSYGFNSMSLFIEYLKKHIEIEYFPPMFTQLGGGLDKVNIDTEIDKQITKIVGRIRELQKESQPSSTEQNKSLQIQNPLSVGEFLGWVHAHKCSKCGWGIKVDIFNKVATCPKCGNVDNVYEGKESQLVIENVKRENYGNVAGFSWGLVVRNKGTDKAEECIGELVAIDFADKTGMSLKTWPTNQPLQWGNIPEYSGSTTDIIVGRAAILQVINRDLVRGVIRIHAQHIAYSRSYEFRETHYLPVSNYPGGNNYLIVVGISSKGRLPIFAVCYLRSRQEDYCEMRLIEVMADEPNLEEYRQKSAAHIAEIEKQLTSEWYHETGMDSHDC